MTDADVIGDLSEYGMKAVWADDPLEQVAINLVLLVIFIASSAFTAGATLFLAAITLGLALAGFLRFIVELMGYDTSM